MREKRGVWLAGDRVRLKADTTYDLVRAKPDISDVVSGFYLDLGARTRLWRHSRSYVVAVF
jgi:hypothetical protein